MSRLDVRSADGTSLAVWVDGAGPPLVLVHGSVSDHTTLSPLVDELAKDLTTFALDRRGFGASGDGPGYAIDHDFADIAIAVDAVADRTGAPVGLFGHSYGASCAMGAAALTDNVHHLVLYEPSLGVRYPPGSIETVESAVAAGDLDAAVVSMFVDILELSRDEIAAMRASTSPPWATRIAAAHTLPRECRAEEGWAYQPGQFDGITAPTLLLAGSDSPAEMSRATHAAAAAIPNSRIRVLEGHGHMAHKTNPAMVATIVRQFMLS